MKNLQRPDKLALRKETVRTLRRGELADAIGGDVTSTVRPTRVICPVGGGDPNA